MKMKELLAVMDPTAELYVNIIHGDADEDGYRDFTAYAANKERGDDLFFGENCQIMNYFVEWISHRFDGRLTIWVSESKNNW